MGRIYKSITLGIETKTHLMIFYKTPQIYNARKRSYSEFEDEVIKGGNECAKIDNYCITPTGRKFIHWYDTETLEEFITEIQ